MRRPYVHHMLATAARELAPYMERKKSYRTLQEFLDDIHMTSAKRRRILRLVRYHDRAENIRR